MSDVLQAPALRSNAAVVATRPTRLRSERYPWRRPPARRPRRAAVAQAAPTLEMVSDQSLPERMRGADRSLVVECRTRVPIPVMLAAVGAVVLSAVIVAAWRESARNLAKEQAVNPTTLMTPMRMEAR